MVIGFRAVENRRTTWLDAMRYIARYSPELVKLAGHISNGYIDITQLPRVYRKFSKTAAGMRA